MEGIDILTAIHAMLSHSKCQLTYQGEPINSIGVSHAEPESSAKYIVQLATSDHEDFEDGRVGVKFYVIEIGEKGEWLSDEEKWMVS